VLGFGALGEFALGEGPADYVISISGVMSALETKDTFFGGGSVWNRVNSAEIGIIDTSSPDVEIGVAIPTVARVRVSIRMA
jgi:hypothetical protein